MKRNFDTGSFYSALDANRQARGLTWKQVAEESGVNASTLTRIGKGNRPDIDGLSALLRWAGLSADDFISSGAPLQKPEPLAKIAALLRNDPNLSSESAVAMESILRTAYKNLRDKR